MNHLSVESVTGILIDICVTRKLVALSNPPTYPLVYVSAPISYIEILKVLKVKFSPLQALEALRVVRG
jgi:hypothetical protein